MGGGGDTYTTTMAMPVSYLHLDDVSEQCRLVAIEKLSQVGGWQII